MFKEILTPCVKSIFKSKQQVVSGITKLKNTDLMKLKNQTYFQSVRNMWDERNYGVNLVIKKDYINMIN